MSFILRNITSGPAVAIDLGDLGITVGIPAAEVTDVTTVADVAGSLSSTFFTLDTITTKYYVWYDVDNGNADPAPAGRTSIEVDISANDTANTVASNTQAAVNAVTDFSATVLTNVVTITHAALGTVENARDGSPATGFTFAVTTQGDGTVDLGQESAADVARSTDLVDAIGAGDVIVLDPLDGATQLSAANSLTAVGVHNDPHFRIVGGRINDIDDVDTTIIATDDALIFTGTNWVPGSITGTINVTNELFVRQMKFNPIAAVSASTIIPADNTVPLVTEGTQIWTDTLTPKATNSIIRVDTAFVLAGSSSNMDLTMAVFRGSTCVGAASHSTGGKDVPNVVSFTIYDTPATTSALTYQVRVGRDTTPTGSWNVNSVPTGNNLAGQMEQLAYTLTELAIA